MQDNKNEKPDAKQDSTLTDELRQIITNYNNVKKKREQITNDIINAMKPFLDDMIRIEFADYEKHHEDLFACGIIGVLDGLKTYDPLKDDLIKHFTSHIRQQISDFVTEILQKRTDNTGLAKEDRNGRQRQ